MPKTRNQVAAAIADVFIPLERSADETASQAYRCVATMMEQRAVAKVAPLTGNDAIELMRQGADHAARARECFLKAHPLLAVLGEQNGVTPRAFGQTDECRLSAEANAPATLKLVG